MKSIEIDEELYQYIAANTKFIGESASAILRRLLAVDSIAAIEANISQQDSSEIITETEKPIPVTTAKKAVNQEEPVVARIITKTSGQSIFDLINKEELAMQRGAVGRFLLILSNLNRVHPNQFDAVLDIRGRDRLYFAGSETALLENGSSTKPKQIPDSNFWVITNSNTTKKKLMLTDVANVLGYSSEEAEIIRDFL